MMGISFGILAICIAAFGFFGTSPASFILINALLFLFWGDIFSLFAATVGDAFGRQYVTVNYGLMYTAKGVAAILVPFGNVLTHATGSWHAVYIIGCVMSAVAALLAFFVLKPVINARLRHVQALPAFSPEEAKQAAAELGGQVVVKAQVLTGGRGKAGGVKLADDPADAEQKARGILGLDIRGHVVRKLWIEQASDIAKEYYLSITFDRGAKKPLFMFTTQGGVEIEEVAAESPEALVRLHVDPLEGFQPWVARRLVYGGGVEDPSEQKQIAAIVEKLYRAFVEFDAMLCEINPLIVTPEGEVKALDSKFTVDDSALPRHPDIAEWRDPTAADPIETFAREKGVTYVKLDGNVGVLANGAGLGMSTVDVVAHAGGRPANFCDLGGGGSAEGVVDALEVITRDEQVRSIFFNIFGGITRCDEVARGILAALDRLDMSRYPIVVRLDGTNAEEGRQILADAGRENIHPEATMLDGARRAVELAA